MSTDEIKATVAAIIARLDKLELRVEALGARTSQGGGALEMIDLPTLASKSLPNRVAVEPFEVSGKSGKWRCDPRVISALQLNGRNIPFTDVVFYRLVEMSWRPAPNAQPYTQVCPQVANGGLFPQLKLHALVFGLGKRGVGCQSSFAIEGVQPEPVWIAVNDTNYEDNDGFIVIQMSW